MYDDQKQKSTLKEYQYLELYSLHLVTNMDIVFVTFDSTDEIILNLICTKYHKFLILTTFPNVSAYILWFSLVRYQVFDSNQEVHNVHM